MSKFMIVREGGTEIVLNREPEFTVSCTEAWPDINNIHYCVVLKYVDSNFDKN